MPGQVEDKINPNGKIKQNLKPWNYFKCISIFKPFYRALLLKHFSKKLVQIFFALSGTFGEKPDQVLDVLGPGLLWKRFIWCLTFKISIISDTYEVILWDQSCPFIYQKATSGFVMSPMWWHWRCINGKKLPIYGLCR
jgi:hypothetical protein